MTALIALIVGEVCILYLGISLVAILGETNNRKFIKHILPAGTILGFIILIIYLSNLFK
jgi:hypothetical protein